MTGAPGWDRVRQSFLDPEIARDALPAVLSGLWLNVRLLVCCAVGALLLGLVIAVLRTLRGPVFFPVRALAAGYTYTFRGLPLIIVLYLLAFGVPGLRLQGMPPVLVLGGIALVLTYGGYVAEVFRAGIESVHPSQLRRGPLAGPDLPADDAARGAAAGRPPGGAAAAQRPGGAAEGRRAGLARRADRRGPRRADRHRRRRSTTRRTSWRGCSSCCSRSR